MPSQQSFTELNPGNISEERDIKNAVEGHIKAIRRLKAYRRRQYIERNKEVRTLVNFQSTAMQAIHLQSIMQPLRIVRPKDPLNKLERERLDKLLQEERKWLTVTYELSN